MIPIYEKDLAFIYARLLTLLEGKNNEKMMHISKITDERSHLFVDIELSNDDSEEILA